MLVVPGSGLPDTLGEENEKCGDEACKAPTPIVPVIW